MFLKCSRMFLISYKYSVASYVAFVFFSAKNSLLPPLKYASVISGPQLQPSNDCRDRPAMLPPHTSLVQYDNPVLVSTSSKANKGKGGEKQTLTPTEDILNSILPPREWTEVQPLLWYQPYCNTSPVL
jgi:hypothetical protein